MSQADFAYAPANDVAGLPLAASIFADRAHVRDELREDVEAAGLAVHDCAPLAALFEGEPRALGEVVLLDCPQVDARGAGGARPARLARRAVGRAPGHRDQRRRARRRVRLLRPVRAADPRRPDARASGSSRSAARWCARPMRGCAS